MGDSHSDRLSWFRSETMPRSWVIMGRGCDQVIATTTTSELSSWSISEKSARKKTRSPRSQHFHSLKNFPLRRILREWCSSPAAEPFHHQTNNPLPPLRHNIFFMPEFNALCPIWVFSSEESPLLDEKLEAPVRKNNGLF